MPDAEEEEDTHELPAVTRNARRRMDELITALLILKPYADQFDIDPVHKTGSLSSAPVHATQTGIHVICVDVPPDEDVAALRALGWRDDDEYFTLIV